MMTTWCVRARGLNSLMVYFNAKSPDVWEGNATIRGEIWITNIYSLGFQDIGKELTLIKEVDTMGFRVYFTKQSQLCHMMSK